MIGEPAKLGDEGLNEYRLRRRDAKVDLAFAFQKGKRDVYI